MAEYGTAGLSLRGIARELDVTAPALYNYYARLDDLITALIVDAYTALAEVLEAADAGQPRARHADRLMAVLLAYREWAMAHPVDFSLIYGNPIPGYRAPAEATTPPARRGFAVILAILAEALASGELQPQPEHLHQPPDLHVRLPSAGETQAEPVPPAVIYLGVMGWTRIHGMIMLELFNHTDTLVDNHAAFYRHEVESLLRSIGLSITGEPTHDT